MEAKHALTPAIKNAKDDHSITLHLTSKVCEGGCKKNCETNAVDKSD